MGRVSSKAELKRSMLKILRDSGSTTQEKLRAAEMLVRITRIAKPRKKRVKTPVPVVPADPKMEELMRKVPSQERTLEEISA